jgi:hypothetical protein
VTRPEAGRNGNEDRTGREARVGRAPKKVIKKLETIPRVSRGKWKGAGEKEQISAMIILDG